MKVNDLNGNGEITADDVLNSVRDPELFIDQLREAQRDRQLRRNLFIDSLSPEVKAEWINGEAVYHSPAREAHNHTVHGLSVILGNFSIFKGGLIIRIEKAMIEAGQNNFEPDVCVWKQADHKFAGDLVVYPRPDLAVEVLSQRTSHRDKGVKKVEYALAGTSEYWIIDADARILNQYKSVNDKFELHTECDASSTIASTYISGLTFPLNAIWEADALADWTKQLIAAQ